MHNCDGCPFKCYKPSEMLMHLTSTCQSNSTKCNLCDKHFESLLEFKWVSRRRCLIIFNLFIWISEIICLVTTIQSRFTVTIVIYGLWPKRRLTCTHRNIRRKRRTCAPTVGKVSSGSTVWTVTWSSIRKRRNCCATSVVTVRAIWKHYVPISWVIRVWHFDVRPPIVCTRRVAKRTWRFTLQRIETRRRLCAKFVVTVSVSKRIWSDTLRCTCRKVFTNVRIVRSAIIERTNWKSTFCVNTPKNRCCWSCLKMYKALSMLTDRLQRFRSIWSVAAVVVVENDRKKQRKHHHQAPNWMRPKLRQRRNHCPKRNWLTFDRNHADDDDKIKLYDNFIFVLFIYYYC